LQNEGFQRRTSVTNAWGRSPCMLITVAEISGAVFEVKINLSALIDSVEQIISELVLCVNKKANQ